MSPCSPDAGVRPEARTGDAQPTRPKVTEMATPFPWLAMVAIALCLVTVAYTLCNLFPYSGYMVRQLGVADNTDEAGYYAGYLSSAFMVGLFGGSYFWGRFADTYGRLPVLYIGLCSTAVLSVAFGMSTTLLWAVAYRFFLGALNGMMATTTTMVSEVCGVEHEVVGMSFVIGCRSVALVVGSGLGGMLAEPANHYPSIFSESGLFGRFPYLLPNAFGAGLALISLPMVFFFLKETLDVPKCGDRRGLETVSTPAAKLHIQEKAGGERVDVIPTSLDNGYDPQLASAGGAGTMAKNGGLTNGNNGGSNGGRVRARVDERLPLVEQRLGSTSGAQDLEEGTLLSARNGARGNARSGGGGIEDGEGVDSGGGDNSGGWMKIDVLHEILVPMKLLEQKQVRTALFVYVLFSGIDTGFDEAYPLWAISSVDSGGLDWTTQQVGQVLAACGVSLLVFQLLVYPWILKRIGTTTAQLWASCVTIPVYLAYPFLSLLGTSGHVLMISTFVLLFLTNIAENALFTNISLAINNAVDPAQRGTLNGLSMMLGSLATSAGPTVFSIIFAWSINKPRPFPLDRHLIFCLFGLGMFVVTASSWNLVISPGEQTPEGYAASSVVVAEEAAGGIQEKEKRAPTHGNRTPAMSNDDANGSISGSPLGTRGR